MREKLVLSSVVMVVVLAGCMGGMTSYEAPPAEPSEDVAEEHDYVLADQEKIEFNESGEVAGVEQSFEATSWLTMYEKETGLESMGVDDSPAAYATLSTPSIGVMGQEFNPLVLELTDRFIDEFEDEVDELTIHEQADEINVTIEKTDENITVEQYEATFEMSEVGAELDGYVLTSVNSTDDAVVIAIGAYPEMMEGEKENVLDLIKNTDAVEQVEVEEEE